MATGPLHGPDGTDHRAASRSAAAPKKDVNDRAAAHTPTLWNRSAWATCAFQSAGGALGSHATVALLIGTVPTTLIPTHARMAATPAQRSPKPGAAD